MGFGKMKTFVDIISVKPVKDSEGFTEKDDVILASVRAYKEDRHGSENGQTGRRFRRRLPCSASVRYLTWKLPQILYSFAAMAGTTLSV